MLLAHTLPLTRRFGGAVGLIAAGVTAWGVIVGEYGVLCASMVIYGVYAAVQNPSMEALFADSTPKGLRSQYNTYKYILLQIAYASGPLVAVIMFWLLGDTWELGDCEKVILIGLLLSVVSSALCFFFNDDKAYQGGCKYPALS